jgi:hypothetical protein
VSRLPQLRASLLDAAQQQANASTRRAGAPARGTGGRRPLRLVALAVLCVLLLAGAALAASGILRTGSPVPSAGRLLPTVGFGVPSRGGSRLLAVRSSDPDGGPAWGMRVVHTTRDLVCIQVGRVYDGQLGVLGSDGAFANDGQFHRLPVQSTDGLGEQCALAGTYSSDEISGMPESALMARSGRLGALRRARWLSFGLLGPHAVSISYRYGGKLHTVAVERLTGAYMIVLPGIEPGTRGIQAGGSSEPRAQRDGIVNPSGVLTTITYRLDGALCEENVQQEPSKPCPRGAIAHPQPFLTPSRELHRPIQVRVRRASTPGDYSATVRFRAPYAVKNALSEYSITNPASCHGGTVLDPIDRDVKAGALVTVSMQAIFANACGRSVTLEVLYNPRAERPVPSTGIILVGSVTVTRPLR